MNGLKLLALPGSVLALIAIGYAYGLSGSCVQLSGYRERDLQLISAGVVLSLTTAGLGYRSGLAKRKD